MGAIVIPFTLSLPVPRVEISSPGVTKDGERIFFVDIIEAGCRNCMWDGPDLDEAQEAAAHCAESEGLPVLDLTNPSGVLQ